MKNMFADGALVNLWYRLLSTFSDPLPEVGTYPKTENVYAFWLFTTSTVANQDKRNGKIAMLCRAFPALFLVSM